MVITRCARRLTLGALLALLPLGGALADSGIKPAIVGLVSTGSQTNTLDELSDRMGIFGGIVIQAVWATLEPNAPSTPNGPVVLDTSSIDSALDSVRKYNEKAAKLSAPNNRQIGVRLRVFAGCTPPSGVPKSVKDTNGVSDAPAWAMNLNGGPITFKAEYSKKLESCTFGRFWDPTSSYAAAWRQFQAQLAAQYDTHPLIQEVAVTSCTSYSAEPFFLPYTNANDTTAAVLTPRAVGYSDATYQQCLAQAVVNDYAPWKRTRLEFTFNPFYGLSSPSQADVAFSERVMRGCRQAAGQRCILSNHDLDATTSAGILPIYAFERKFGPNITFQTLHVNPKDFEGTLRKGISLGAGSIEVWQEPKGFEAQSNATLANWAAMFEPQ